MDRSSRCSICARAVPVVKGQIVVFNAIACSQCLIRPVCVEIEGVGVGVAHEIVELAVVERSAAPIALDHEHLVAILGVDVIVLHVENC